MALLVTRQWRRWLIFTAGWLLTSLLLSAADRWVTSSATPDLPDYGLALDTAEAWPPSQAVAQAVFALVWLTPRLRRSWRR